MADINVKFLTGAKENIDSKINNGTIEKGGLIITSDSDELVFVNPDAEKRFVTSRTQKSYTLNGTSLGSLEDGATIDAGINIDDLLTIITQKEIPATYTAPIVTFKVNNNTVGTKSYELGEVINLTLAADFTQNDAGPITGISLHQDSSVLATASTSSISRVFEYSVGDSTKLWASANYAAGPIKNNNLGQESPEGAISAGTIASKNIYIKGIRNLFLGSGTGDIPELTSSIVRGLTHSEGAPTTSSTIELSMAIGEQYVIFAYPSNLRDLTQVEYVELGDKGMASLFEKSLVQVEGANGYEATEYKVYTYRTAAPIAAPMTLKFTI